MYHSSQVDNIRELQVANAERSSDSAKVTAALSNERAQEAIAKQRELEQTNLKLSIEVEKLKLAAGDRFIPNNLRENFVSVLSKYSSREVLIDVIGAEDEPIMFAESLRSVLLSIGWEVDLTRSAGIMIPRPTGINVTACGEKNKEIARFIREQFSSLGYRYQFVLGEERNVDIGIGIAPKE